MRQAFNHEIIMSIRKSTLPRKAWELLPNVNFTLI